MSTMIQRLASLSEIGSSPVSQVLQDMGGLVCLHGPNAARYMQAIQAVTEEIEKEQEREH